MPETSSRNSSIEGPEKPVPFLDAVDLWRARLDVPAGRFEPLLSADEKQRAERLVLEHRRREFVVSRGTLRIILARYLNAGPAALEFQTNSQGRPFLAGKWGKPGPGFNLSHSGGRMLLAVANSAEVGVDLERIRPVPGLERIAGRFFAPGEAERLFGLPGEERLEAFFACWTRKEAFLKALGQGLLFPLKGFEVEFLPGRPAGVISIGGDVEPAREWILRDVDAGEEFAAALALRVQTGS